jgi:hypothetical protein
MSLHVLPTKAALSPTRTSAILTGISNAIETSRASTSGDQPLGDPAAEPPFRQAKGPTGISATGGRNLK